MLTSTIGSSTKGSKFLIRTLAKTAELFGLEVRPDTIKRRVRDANGEYKRKADGTCVYEAVGFCDNRFFVAPKVGVKPSRIKALRDAYILTARKAKFRETEDSVGDTYTSYHRGFFTIAREHHYPVVRKSDGKLIKPRYLWDIQNRDVGK